MVGGGKAYKQFILSLSKDGQRDFRMKISNKELEMISESAKT